MRAQVRFLASALANRGYRAEGSPAGAAVGVLLAGPPCAALLEALVGKYLAVTPEELAEWQVQHLLMWSSRRGWRGSTGA